MTFDEELAELAFGLVQSGRDGTRRYVRKDNPFMQWWLHVFGDGTVELTWEFELGAYLKGKGFTISVQDELSLLLFPSGEVRGPAEGAWISSEIEHAEQHLSSIALPEGT